MICFAHLAAKYYSAEEIFYFQEKSFPWKCFNVLLFKGMTKKEKKTNTGLMGNNLNQISTVLCKRRSLENIIKFRKNVEVLELDFKQRVQLFS